MSRDKNGGSQAQNEVARNESNGNLQHETSRTESDNTLHRVTSHQESHHGIRREPTRNQQFDPEYEPFRDNHALQLNDEEVNGVLWFMYPTRAMFTYLGSAERVWDDQGSEEFISRQDQEYADHSSHTSDIEYKWTSRNNRKGRHALVVHQSSEHYDMPPPTTGLYSILRGIYRMATTFTFWDISYLTAIVFTLAVVILLVNAVLAVMPYASPQWVPPAALIYVEGSLTFAGCCLFLLSSFLSWVEAVNAKHRGCFGWKREHISYLDVTESRIEHGAATRIVPDWNCVHRTHNVANIFQYSNHRDAEESEGSTDNLFGIVKTKDSSQDKDQWRWFPTKRELCKHFIYDLGFVTCTVLLLSSAVYCSAAIASLVSILKTDGEVAHWIRIPQVIAGLGFVTSSVLFM